MVTGGSALQPSIDSCSFTDSDPPPTSSRSTYTPIASTSTYIPPSTSNSYQAGAPVSRLATGNAYSSAPSGGASGLETTLPYDLGLLAAAAYALGPFGAAVLLVLEVESDYARFHAYQVSRATLASNCRRAPKLTSPTAEQSALLCTSLLSFNVLQYLLFGSSILTWLLVVSEAAILLLLRFVDWTPIRCAWDRRGSLQADLSLASTLTVEEPTEMPTCWIVTTCR